MISVPSRVYGGRVSEFCFASYDKLARLKDAALFRSKSQRDERSEERAKYWTDLKERTLKYFAEVKASRFYHRLILKPPDAEEPSRLLLGFLTERPPGQRSLPEAAVEKYFDFAASVRAKDYPGTENDDVVLKRVSMFLSDPRNLVQAPIRLVTKYLTGKAHDFTPFKGLYHVVVRTPLTAATRRLAGKPLQFSRLIDFPLSIGVGFFLYSVFEDEFEKALKQKILVGIKENAAEYDFLIENDARFLGIKRDLEAARGVPGGLTQEQARVAAYILLDAHKNYDAYLAGEGKTDSPEDRRAKRLALMHILAPHLPEIFSRGVVAMEGFEVPEKAIGPLSDEQKDRILDAQDIVFARMHALGRLARGDEGAMLELYPPPRQVPAFVRDVMDLKREGSLSDAEAYRLLQQDQEWQARFVVCEILGITPLNEFGAPLDLLQTQIQAVTEAAQSRLLSRELDGGAVPARD